ncbi:MAG: N-acetylmuramoyl-L-alanine amidase [Bacteroidota bacterium]
MPRNFLLLILYFFATHSLLADDARFHRVPAKDGDNITRLLKRYELHSHDCNFKKFYALNDLTRDSELVKGRKYYIPVKIHTYNGVSIRTTLNIKGWEQALRIKRYNERMKKNKLRRSTIAKSNILWVPYHELNCEDDVNKEEPLSALKPKKDAATEKAELEARKRAQEEVSEKVLTAEKANRGVGKYGIFGKEHAAVSIKDHKLKGKVYYIVSGHGGPDPGAVGRASNNPKQLLCEDEYAYDVSLRLARVLIEHGALVYMITRDPNDGIRSGKYLKGDKDEYCWPKYKIPRSQKRRLYQRSDAVNELYERHRRDGGYKEMLTIIIHIDSRSTSENTDVFFYHFPGSKKGRDVARKLHKTFKEKYRQYRKGGRYTGTVTARDLHMLREPKTTSVFIELGNIKNRHDQQRFLKESNREALAKWMYEGLIR